MIFGKFFRRAAALITAFCVLMMCGCSVRFGTTPQDGDIVAKPTKNASSDLEVTYAEFNQQYLYFLWQRGIEDDTDSSYADACFEQREEIINSLILTKIYLKKAKELNVPELSEEERSDIKEILDKQFEQQAMYYGKKAMGLNTDNSGSTSDISDSDSDQSGFSDEEILERGNEEFDKMLSECGITRDDIRQWSEEYTLITKVTDEIVKGVTRDDAEKQTAEGIKSIEKMYNSENKAYYYDGGYDRFWVPEGSRRIKHVLLGFDKETLTRIQAFRKEEKDEEADALRAEKAKEFTEKIEQVEKLLDDNIDFNTILLNYSADVNRSSVYPDGYLVTSSDDENFVEEFSKAAFAMEKPGDRTRCTSDYGVHIMIYASDAKPDEEAIEDITDKIYEEMCQEAIANKLNEWHDEYSYEIDREKLRIEKQALSS